MNRTSLLLAGFVVAGCLGATDNFANTLNFSSAIATLSVSSHWGTGYCVNIDIKAGSGSVSDWSLQIDTNGTQINNLWNGHLSGNDILPMSCDLSPKT
jgi:cellulase/cellobiase CelA1